MEPSLRSSAPKGIQCKFRKPDPSLHETTQRFVESLLGDIRVSQYADMNYASTMMRTGKWMFLEPLGGGKVGFLVMSPKSPVIWMDEHGKSAYIIPMRIQSTLCEKGSIAIASLNRAEGILRIEDMKVLAGEDMTKLSFTKRWERLLYFYRNSYVFDSSLQQGLKIEPAVYRPIDSIQSWTSQPDFIFAQNDALPRRLRIQIKEVKEKPKETKLMIVNEEQGEHVQQRPHVAHQPQQQKPVEKPVEKPVQKPVQKPKIQILKRQKVEDKIIAIPSEEYPDTYTIVINGERKGYAAVQDIELSRILRQAATAANAKDLKEIPVKVEWNPEFSSYEILSLL